MRFFVYILANYTKLLEVFLIMLWYSSKKYSKNRGEILGIR